MSSVKTLRHWLGRLGKDTLYLLTGLPMGILTFTVAVTGWSTGLGLLITLIGFPVLLLTTVAIRGLSHVERSRAKLVLDEPLVARYKEPSQPGIWARCKSIFSDAQNWRDLVWALLLLGVGIAGFTIAVTAIGVVLGMVFAPAWTWALWDSADPPDLGLFHVTDIWTSLAATAIGIAIAPLGLALVRGSAAATGALARALLAPRTEVLEERVEVLQATRAGAVDAAAAELERIERDLHDGAQALQPAAVRIRTAVAVVDDQHLELVLAAHERHRRALGVRVLGNVRQRLGNDEVRRGFDRLGQPLGTEVGGHGRGHRRARRERAHRLGQAALGQQRRPDPARQVAQLH